MATKHADISPFFQRKKTKARKKPAKEARDQPQPKRKKKAGNQARPPCCRYRHRHRRAGPDAYGASARLTARVCAAPHH